MGREICSKLTTSKRRQKQKENLTRGLGCCFADQMAGLEQMQLTLPFIKLIFRSHGKVLCAVMYTNEQIADLRRFCCSAPVGLSTVLCVDKTFNLSELHLTVTTFRHLAVTNQKTHEPPIFAGPMFLHGNSNTSTFFLFFQHLAGLLQGTSSHPVIGSDEEKAIKVAVR